MGKSGAYFVIDDLSLHAAVSFFSNEQDCNILKTSNWIRNELSVEALICLNGVSTKTWAKTSFLSPFVTGQFDKTFTNVAIVFRL